MTCNGFFIYFCHMLNFIIKIMVPKKKPYYLFKGEKWVGITFALTLAVLLFNVYVLFHGGEGALNVFSTSFSTLTTIAAIFISYIAYKDSKDSKNEELLKELISVVKDIRSNQNASPQKKKQIKTKSRYNRNKTV